MTLQYKKAVLLSIAGWTLRKKAESCGMILHAFYPTLWDFGNAVFNDTFFLQRQIEAGCLESWTSAVQPGCPPTLASVSRCRGVRCQRHSRRYPQSKIRTESFTLFPEFNVNFLDFLYAWLMHCNLNQFGKIGSDIFFIHAFIPHFRLIDCTPLTAILSHLNLCPAVLSEVKVRG